MVSTRQMATSSSSGGSGAGTSTNSGVTRHSHLTQAVKGSGSGATAAGGGSSSGLVAVHRAMPPPKHLIDLPTEILSKILCYVGYKKIAQLRVVSHSFNDVCMHILNTTFSKVIKLTYNRFHAIKASMPRRESARRIHPLACECDIIETCYMRLSLLQMAFGKHIERGHCCFFPGAILDEVYTILYYIKNTPRLERPFRVTDELFDLSTMAMEYFKDRIEPTLPDIAYFNKTYFKLPTTKRPALVITPDHSDSSSSSSLPSPPQSNMVLRKGIRKIKQGMKIYNNQLSVLRNELRTCKRKSSEQGKQIGEQQKLLEEQQKQTLEYANRLDENDKKNEEMSRKFSTLLQELNKCKTELQYWRSKSPAIPTCTSCGHKVAPVLPPEDYQALINQGVKPEDIILNVNDDSDVSMGEHNNLTLSSEFVFPDEATTAKVLAVNTATKNLKRKHNVTTSNTNTSTSTASSSGGEIFNDDDGHHTSMSDGTQTPDSAVVVVGDHPSEMTNSLEYARGGGHPIIRATPSSSQGKDLSYVSGATCSSSSSNTTHTSGLSTASSGYSTKLFYGTNVHKGVIVSPPSVNNLLLAKMETSNIATAVDEENAGNAVVVAAAAGGAVTAAAAASTAAVEAVEDIAALQSITSHETKKARRVQKATRCLNGSGKRSK